MFMKIDRRRSVYVHYHSPIIMLCVLKYVPHLCLVYLHLERRDDYLCEWPKLWRVCSQSKHHCENRYHLRHNYETISMPICCTTLPMFIYVVQIQIINGFITNKICSMTEEKSVMHHIRTHIHFHHMDISYNKCSSKCLFQFEFYDCFE